MKFKGKAHKYGDNINTDEIIPARYLTTTDPQQLAKHCLEDLDKKFIKKVSKGDILVVGKNFGCGSSREHAPLSIRYAGISVVIAESFARIFFRNAINTGLPIIECKEASFYIEDGNLLTVDINKGIIENLTKKERYKFKAFPKFLQEIISSGGLMEKLKKER